MATKQKLVKLTQEAINKLDELEYLRNKNNPKRTNHSFLIEEAINDLYAKEKKD